MKIFNVNTKIKGIVGFLFALIIFVNFEIQSQTTCPGPWPTSGAIGQPGNWIVIGNLNNGNDPATGYGNVTYQYSYLDRFARLNEYIPFLNAVDPSGTGAYVGNLVNFGMVQYSGGSWQVTPFNSCSSATGQNMTAAEAGQVSISYVSFNLMARFCNWLTTGSVSTGPYTFPNSIPNSTPTSVNLNYPNSVRLPTEDEFYKAAYYRSSNNTWKEYGTQDANLSGGTPIVSGVSSTGNMLVSNGHLYDQPFHWHPTMSGGVCLWQLKAGQGGKSYYNLFNMVGGFHHYLTQGGTSTTMILRPQNQVQDGAAGQHRTFRLTGLDPAEHYVSPSLHLAYYGDACCPVAGNNGSQSVCAQSPTTLDLNVVLTGESAGGSWTRISGTGGTFNAAAGTFLNDATTSATSVFRYTIAASGGCLSDFADITITNVSGNTAGTASSTIACVGSNTSVDLFSLLTGESSGGTWTRLTGTGGTFNAAAGTYVATSTATTSTFRYRVTNVAPCTTSDAVVTVNISAAPTAGTGTSTTLCDNSTSTVVLSTLLTGEDTGGTWTRVSGTGGTFNAAAGTFQIAAGATSSYFMYSVGGGTSGCPLDTENAIVNINPQANAGTGGSVTECNGSGNTITLANLVTGEQTGGAWTRLTGTGGTFTAGSGTFVVTAGTTASTFRYSVAGTAPCVNATADVTVNITASPTAGTGTSTSVCDNSSSTIVLNSLLTGEDTGGTWTRTSGTGGTFNAAAGTFQISSGATSSTFNYTVGGGGCPTDNESVAVNISPQLSAGTGGSTLECAGSNASIVLSSLLTGAPTGGTWSQFSGSGGTFNAGAGTFVTTSTATTSVFRYTVSGTAPCVSSTADVTVNITASPTAGTGSSTSVCDNSTLPISLNGLLSGEDLGGTWTRTSGTGGTFNAAGGSFTPAVGASTSTFNYVVGGGGCPSDNESVTINISPQVSAGTGSSTLECAGSNATITLNSLLSGAPAGGTWTRTSGSGGTFNAGAGTFVTTSTATTSVFRYTVAGTAPCVSSTADVTVNITSSPTAGTGSSTSVCDDSTSPINLNSLLTGEDLGGTWTRTGGTGGTFNAVAGTFIPATGATMSTFSYQVGGGGCPTDSEVVTVNISPQVSAGTGSSTLECAGSNATITLNSLLSGAPAGGTWTRTSGSGGTFNAGAGTFVTTSTATTSVFRYTVAGTAPCVSSTADVTVNITSSPTAGTGSSTSVCDNSTAPINLNSLLTGEDSGGTWTRTGGTGGTFNAVAGTFTPATGASTSTFSYQVGGGGCPTDSEVVTINIAPQVNAGTGSATLECAGSDVTITLSSLLTGSASGGTWTRTSGSGGTFSAGDGTFITTSTATTSVFRYSIAGTAPCLTSTADVTVNITGAPTAGTGSGTTVCDDSTAPIVLNSLLTGEDTGGTWTRTAGSGGSFNAVGGTFTPAAGATTSTFNYQVGGSGCPIDNEVVTVNISHQANAGSGNADTDCAGSNNTINLNTLISGGQTGGAWTRLTGTGGTFNGGATGTYIVSPSATTSTFRYTISATSPCVADMADVTVNITAAPVAGTGSSLAICDNSTTLINLYNMLTGEDTGGTWTRTSGSGGNFDPTAGTFMPSLGATSSTFRYTVGGSGCPIDNEDVTINITPRAYAGLDGTTEECEGGGIVITLSNVINGEQAGGTWTRLSGAGGVFDPIAGTYALTTGAGNSTFRYLVAGTAPCMDDEAIATVNVTGSCCVISSMIITEKECIDTGTPEKMSDNKIRFRMMILNQNPLLSNFTLTVNGGTTITPSSGVYNAGGVYTLGAGTGGSGSTFTITVTDSTIPGCSAEVSVIDPGNCPPGTSDCEPSYCNIVIINGVQNPSTNGSGVVSAFGAVGCTGNGTITGMLTQGELSRGAIMTIYANVTTLGSYNISAIQNGVTFNGNGNFVTLGCQLITLSATGRPTAAGSTTWTTNTTPSVSATANVIPAISPSTNGTGVVSAYGGVWCVGQATISGTMTKGVIVSGVTMSLYANVTQLGTYNLTAINNGVTFMANGTFASLGCQLISLNAVGTPSNTGTFLWETNTTPSGSASRAVSAPLGSIASLDCAGATNIGTLTSATAASGVTSSIPYTGGNGGTHSGQTVTSTGVTGLTATLAAGSFATGSGTLTYNITGTPSAAGTASFAINIGGQACTLTRNVVIGAGTITSVDCAGATQNGTLTSGTAASGVSSVIPYTGGNGGAHSGQTVTSTGVTGLTATLAAGSFATGSGTLTYNITGTPSAAGTASFAINIGGQACTLTRNVVIGAGTITSLDCAGATQNGTLTSGTAASGVSSVIPYTGGNGGAHSGQTVTSTGVTGLTATLAAGSFATGSGTLTYIITGTPSAAGTASFAINIGGQTCTLTRTVNSNYAVCAVNMGGGVTKNWLCHNLGADVTADPHIPSWRLHGAYIQWGKRGPNITGDATVDWQTAPSNGPLGFAAAPTQFATNEGGMLGWSYTYAPTGSWNSGTETTPIKTANDPCPPGFRVPTRTECVALVNNNTKSVTGSWYESTSNYGTAVHFGPNASTKQLTFPAAGSRLGEDWNGHLGELYERGIYSSTWLSGEINGTSGHYMVLGNSISLPGNAHGKLFGKSIRCIQE